jgi:recombination protein RecA
MQNEGGIITQKGAFYSYNQTKLGQGKEQVREFLFKNKKIAEEIEKEVRKRAR